MVRPNYRDFRLNPILPVVQDSFLKHSAKGSTWEEHKYIKRIDGTYYYPDSYEGGRHLPDGEDEESDSKDNSVSKDDMLSKLEEMTGMKRESLDELYNLSKTKGYNSSEFKELLSELSEGDDDQAKKMTDLMKNASSSKIDLSENDVENLAKEVIRGNFGNGQVRKDLLGENYAEVQKRVNELMNGTTGSTKTSEASSESIKKVEEAAKNASSASSNVHSGVDLDKVLEVYKKKKKREV